MRGALHLKLACPTAPVFRDLLANLQSTCSCAVDYRLPNVRAKHGRARNLQTSGACGIALRTLESYGIRLMAANGTVFCEAVRHSPVLASLPPGLPQDANPIAPGDLLNDVFAITAAVHRCHQHWQAGCIANRSRHRSAVKV